MFLFFPCQRCRPRKGWNQNRDQAGGDQTGGKLDALSAKRLESVVYSCRPGTGTYLPAGTKRCLSVGADRDRTPTVAEVPLTHDFNSDPESPLNKTIPEGGAKERADRRESWRKRWRRRWRNFRVGFKVFFLLLFIAAFVWFFRK